MSFKKEQLLNDHTTNTKRQLLHLCLWRKCTQGEDHRCRSQCHVGVCPPLACVPPHTPLETGKTMFLASLFCPEHNAPVLSGLYKRLLSWRYLFGIPLYFSPMIKGLLVVYIWYVHVVGDEDYVATFLICFSTDNLCDRKYRATTHASTRYGKPGGTGP